jgi:SpoVK/Ycf46/Vps4 family AAA+-type ATPase
MSLQPTLRRSRSGRQNSCRVRFNLESSFGKKDLSPDLLQPKEFQPATNKKIDKDDDNSSYNDNDINQLEECRSLCNAQIPEEQTENQNTRKSIDPEELVDNLKDDDENMYKDDTISLREFQNDVYSDQTDHDHMQQIHHSDLERVELISKRVDLSSSSHDHHHNENFGCEENQKRQKLNIQLCMEMTRLKDIVGHAAVKLRIEEIILPLGLPLAIADSVLKGIRSIPSSILLHGPPGCGKVCMTKFITSLISKRLTLVLFCMKTQMARAIAGEAQAAFLSIAPSDVLSKFVGESEAAVRNIFRKAHDLALQLESKCTVVFFDEIDALGQTRDNREGEGEGCSRRVLAELLLQLNLVLDRKHFHTRSHTASDRDRTSCSTDYANGICSGEAENTTDDTESTRILVVGATNRMLDCDDALKRRFGVQLEVGLPTRHDRTKMILRHLKGIEHMIIKEELQYLAIRTDSWSGSDIENLVREAAMAPVRECIRAAALLRKRASRLMQRSGDSTSQGGCRDLSDPDTEARSALLNSFQTLRKVTVQDFDHAICFFTGEDSFNQLTYALHSAPLRVNEHYDSSSDEEIF